jgi:hypothetical protein
MYVCMYGQSENESFTSIGYSTIHILDPDYFACNVIVSIYGFHIDRVTTFLNGQFITVYTCIQHINDKYSLAIITPRIFSSKMLYFGKKKDRDSIFTTVTTAYGNQTWKHTGHS